MFIDVGQEEALKRDALDAVHYKTNKNTQVTLKLLGLIFCH